MKLYTKVTICFICFIAIIALSIAGEIPKIIQINGGFMGKIAFPHNLHEVIKNDCNKCHLIFSQKQGIIQELKNKKSLQKKYVMKELCISCHKQQKNSGPTMCYGCHYLIFNIIPSGTCLFF